MSNKNPVLTRYHQPDNPEHDQESHGNWADDMSGADENITQLAREWIGTGRQDNFDRDWQMRAEEVISGNYDKTRPTDSAGFIWDHNENKRRIVKQALNAIAGREPMKSRLFRGVSEAQEAPRSIKAGA